MGVLCISGYEPSILYIRILSHRTEAMRNFGECGFYDVGRIDAATKSALRVARIHGEGPGGDGEGGAQSRCWRGEEAHAGRGGGERSEDDGS